MDDTGRESLLLFHDLLFQVSPMANNAIKLIKALVQTTDDYFPASLIQAAVSVDEAMLTPFQKGFHLRRMVVADLHTPLLDQHGQIIKFINVANIRFNLEDSPQTADGYTEGR
ncbi:hypothetical protein Tco_0084802 [Tanacetum coccineum]